MAILRIFVLVLACLAAPAAGAVSWRLVPGAADVEIDIDSLQQDGTRVAAWLRWWGRAALMPDFVLAASARVHRSALRIEFDCARRTLRTLAATAYDGGGAPLLMASTAGPVLQVRDAEIAWAYDAACDVLRRRGPAAAS